MKKIKYLLPLVLLSIVMSCSDEDSDSDIDSNTDTTSQSVNGNTTPSNEDSMPDQGNSGITNSNDSQKEETSEETENTQECKIVNKDGLIIIEAESFDLKGSWKIKEEDKASGGKFIEYEGPNSYGSYINAAPHEGTVKFSVDAAATYLVRWFMRQPDHEKEDDKANDVYIYFEGDIGYGRTADKKSDYQLTHFEKFVSRGRTDFTYGGAVEIHSQKSSSWMRVKIPAAGEYTLKIRGRSKYFQLDKIVLSTIQESTLEAISKPLTEAKECN